MAPQEQHDNDLDSKPQISAFELASSYGSLSPEDAEFMRQYEGKIGKKVIRKVDRRLLPIMAVLYLLAHIDRGNIGNAKIEGMDKDLGLVGNQYNIASTIFFIPYIIFEIPSNIVLKKVNPTYWISFLVLAWGTVMTCMGVVQDFHGMVVCRFFLGLAESGFFPGAVFIVSSWYQRHELQQRLALFYTASAFSGALSGLLAYGISSMDGARGIAGWRCIFLIEGAVTVAAGLTIPFLLTSIPEKATWLSDDEKRFIDLRLRLSGVRTMTGEGDKFSWRLLRQTMLDWKIWLGIVIGWANATPNAAFKLTLPQIVSGMGFSSSNAQLLTIPPYFCGGVSAWLNGRFADRFKWRFPFLAGSLSLLVVAFAVLFSLAPKVKDNVAGMYVGVMLAQIGIYPVLPATSAWIGNNIAPSWKRSMGLAWLLAAGNFGSLIGTNIFLDSEAPNYPTGYGVSLAVICLGLSSATVLEFSLWRLNKKKAAVSASEVYSRHSQEELDEMGEKSPLFQYIL